MNENTKIPHLILRDCRICYRNFSGKATKFTPEGRRSFSVILDENLGKELLEAGWNVKMKPSRDPEDGMFCTLPVTVRFDILPPRIYLISGNVKTELDEDSVNALDYAEIEKIDLTINPRHYDVNGKTGIKAYLKSMYVTVVQDELAAEYGEFSDPGERDYPRDDDLPF
jgi:hypothetical protein